MRATAAKAATWMACHGLSAWGALQKWKAVQSRAVTSKLAATCSHLCMRPANLCLVLRSTRVGCRSDRLVRQVLLEEMLACQARHEGSPLMEQNARAASLVLHTSDTDTNCKFEGHACSLER